MPIKRTIPGQLREQEMQAIEILASLVPNHGTIVEVGSLLGLSSWIWAKSCHPTVKVYCIDPWEVSGGSNFVNLARNNQQQFTKKQFMQNTADCDNVIAKQGYSPKDFADWNKKINLYFEDAVHTDPTFSQNIDFWSRHLSVDGILCGHDYHPNFPDVCNGAARSAASLGRRLHVIGSLWYILPNSFEKSYNPTLKNKVERLHLLENYHKQLPVPQVNETMKDYSARVVQKIDSFFYGCTLKKCPDFVRQGKPMIIEGYITNKTNVDWPIILMDQAVLKVGGELVSRSGEKLATARAFLNKPVLRAHESADFQLVVDTARAFPGEAQVHIDLVYDHVTWFEAKGAKRTTVEIKIGPAFEFDDASPETPVQDKRFWLQHVKEFNLKSQIGIEVLREQDYVIHASAGDILARSMLTSYELGLLFGLARHHYTGRGKIVDLGPLIGVGTNVMARGVSLNERVENKARAIYSYDLFLMERMDHFLPGEDNPGTGSVFEKFLRNNNDFLDIVCPVPGDVTKMKWTGEEIEILFIDLAKSWQLNKHVVTEFFPSLVPGRSIVIQQDYVHVGEPWIALQMEVFREYFELLYFIYGATAVYRLKKPLPKALLETDLQALSNEEVDAHFARARTHAPPAVGEVLKCCQAAIKTERGDFAAAQALLDTVDATVSDPSERPSNFLPAIPANLAAARRWLDQARKSAGAPGSTAAAAGDEPGRPAGGFTTDQLIRSSYLGILGRDADPVGLARWKERLAGEPIHRLPAALVNSPEFLVSYVARTIKRDGPKAIADINNRLSLAILGARLHAERCKLVAQHLPKVRKVLHLGGASSTGEGALIQMGYRGADTISIVELPPDARAKKAFEQATSGSFEGTHVEYHYHSMIDLSSYEDGSIDLIWSGQTFDHVTPEEGDSIFRQAERVLRPGGIFALDTPNRTLTRLAAGDAGFINAERKHEYAYEEFVERRTASSLHLVDSKGLIDMQRSLQAGYLLPDEIEAGVINDRPQTSFVFYTTYRKSDE